MAHRMPLSSHATAMALALGLLAISCSNWPPSGTDTNGTGTGAVPTTTPPVIDSLDMEASASAVNDVYTVIGSITYHDDDDVVVTVEVTVPVIGKTLTIPVTDPSSEGAGEPFEFNLSADPPLGGAGPTNYSVVLVNKSGAVSAPYAATVDLL
jgi:hypothetical protein